MVVGFVGEIVMAEWYLHKMENTSLLPQIDRDVELWNVNSLELVGHFEGHAGDWVDGVVISPDGRLLASFEKSNLSVCGI